MLFSPRSRHLPECGYGCCTTFNYNNSRERRQAKRTLKRIEARAWKREL